MNKSGFRYTMLAAFAVLFFALVLPSGAQAQSVRPDCDAQIEQIHNRYQSVMRVRNQAATAQIIIRNDSSLQLSCFDQAMALTSTAGQIFSDTLPDLIGLGKAVLASPLQVLTGIGTYSLSGVTIPLPTGGNLTIPIPGLTNFLIMQINNTVGDSMTAMLTQFAGSVLQQLFGIVASQLSSIAIQLLSALIASAGLTSLSSMLGVTLDLSGLLKTVMNSIFGKPQILNCPTMSRSWYNTTPLGGVVGAGVSGGVPYITANNLFNKVFPPGVGANMRLKLDETGNSNLLTQAKGDAQLLANPGAPGAPSSHKAAPVLPPNASLTDVINAM